MVLAVDDFSYVVIVAVRKGYALLWAAYPVQRRLVEELRRACLALAPDRQARSEPQGD